MTWQELGPERVEVLRTFEAGSPLPFRLKMRGYHRLQVEAYFRKLAELAGAGRPPEISPPAFEIVMRGYDRAQVDAFLAPLFQTPRN
ncbi:DivIVA domain-containing protein [Actinomadura sp. WMMA1423]|uniref:DivIVA domain-containing protein n=1 Tax=Actinomadura sp. WMMA1423 TaxID=2591108 RepID=UPI0011464E4E|nr:DivIVA domain-containing protein [Actinomadura sp. WMMA1423]